MHPQSQWDTAGVGQALAARAGLASHGGSPHPAVRHAWSRDSYKPSSQPSMACVKSARMSSRSSSPTESRTRPSCSQGGGRTG
eukprot:3244395-Prymnesium_polylepis.1